MFSKIETWDILIIAAYFGIVFLIAIWVTLQERKKKEASEEGYFLGGRNIGWFVIGASLFASNIGSEHLVGLAGAGARGDMASAQFEILAALILLVLGWIFVPFYLKSGVFTMPEFLEKRYNSSARTFLSVISIIAYVLTKISVTIFAGALVFETMLEVPFWSGATIVVVATGIYTIFGGLKAVIYTDMMQMFVLVGGALALTYFGLQGLAVGIIGTEEAGGWDGVRAAIDALAPERADNYFSLWRDFSDREYPWTGILFGAPILGVWYWCTDQFIVQRVLSAKDESNARKGTIFGGFLKMLPLFLFVIPGLIAFALTQNNPDLLMNTAGEIEYDAALPALVMNYLPVGFKGLMVASLLAALMSSLSSVFNSCSTLFTIDFYQRYRPKASGKELVRVGQIATVVLVVIGLAWIPLMKTLTQGEGIFKYLQSVQAYISPPIAAVFMLGLFFKRINSFGALTSLWTGFVLGVSRLVMEYITSGYEEGTAVWNISPDSWFATYVEVNFLHFAIFLFVVCSVVMFAASMSRPAPAPESLKNVTYEPSGRKFTFSTDVLTTGVLVVIVIVIWFIFSPLGIA